MEKKIFIKYIVIIIIILIIVFLSQQAYFRGMGKSLISDATDKIGSYMAIGSNWVASSVYPKISGEVQKRGEMINNAVNQEKQNVLGNVGTKIENYFSGIANSILHPGENNNPTQNNNCPAQPSQTSASQ